MNREFGYAILIVGAAWILCGLAVSDTRRSLRDGLRCMIRYPDLWRLPALFGFAYAIFQLTAGALIDWREGGEPLEWFLKFQWSDPPPLDKVLERSAAGAAAHTASVFTIFMATFPLSGWFAFLFLVNHGGLMVECFRAFWRRWGKLRGVLLSLAIVLMALAAIAKPFVYLLLPEVIVHVPIEVAFAIDLLSYVFELLLGVYFLTFLMLMAYAWLRGIHFDRHKLLHVAMRRCGFVLKWSLIIAAIAATLIALPLLLGLLLENDAEANAMLLRFATEIGRPVVATIAIALCPIQAILVFHNHSLRSALRECLRLLRQQWPRLVPFVLTVYLTFFLLAFCDSWVRGHLANSEAAALALGLLVAPLEALMAGWLIAAWVCLYKRLSNGGKEISF